MNLCNENGHGEVCYEGRQCPACDRIDELEKEIADREDDIKKLESDNE